MWFNLSDEDEEKRGGSWLASYRYHVLTTGEQNEDHMQKETARQEQILEGLIHIHQGKF